uniref:(California timema) hypothetical protein n=1 Tax=Timema californicum TaxID=61474 RepID=A0A7R9J1D6_TIMCA|nr:unnamed protein product [Timema californicum]
MPPISRPSSSTYWAPHATVIRHRPFSELPPYNSLNTADEPFSCNASVLSTSNNSSRQYVDPWDLENYAFIKRHCPVDDVETDYLTSTPALESSQSDFYYMPNYPEDHARYQPDSLLVTDETSGHFAGIEEEDFYNERFEMFNNCSPHLSSSDGYGGYPSPGISPFTPASCLSPKTTGGVGRKVGLPEERALLLSQCRRFEPRPPWRHLRLVWLQTKVLVASESTVRSASLTQRQINSTSSP